MYKTFIFLHIVSAILATGPLVMIFPLLRYAERERIDQSDAIIVPIQKAVWVVMHGGHLVVTTGVLLILFGPYPWHTSWVVLTVLVMLLCSFFLATAYSKQWKAFERERWTNKQLWSNVRRITWIYIGIMLTMLWLMVTKPVLWSF